MRLSQEKIRDRARRWDAADDSFTLIDLLPNDPPRNVLTGDLEGESELPDLYPEGASEREIGLFVVACCRRVWCFLRDDRYHRTVELAERYIDGRATRDDMRAACEAVRSLVAGSSFWDDGGGCAVAHLADVPWRKLGAQEVAEAAAWAPGPDEAFDEERRAQAEILREIFGNPYRVVRFDPAWRTPEVNDLAKEIDRSRKFGRLAELADLLERAGCDSTELLGHCRRPDGHLRGCWALDLALGREDDLPKR